MSITSDQKSELVSLRVKESADILERHIRACALKPGDRYITTEEAGKLLGKSVVVAQRAMALLAQRNILHRRPKAGTFIGDAVTTESNIFNVHFLFPETRESDPGSKVQYWEQIDGMRSVLGHVSAHFHFIPNQDLGYIQQVIRKASQAGLLNGVILLLPSRQMRSFFNESGIPTVVEGGVEPDLTNLCWMQWDQTQVGRLLATHLLEKGHRRIVTVMRDIWSIGENVLHDSINDTVAAAGLPSKTVRIRSVPDEQAALTGLARSLLTEETPPTAFICRHEFQAHCIAKAAESLGLQNDVEITHCNPSSKPEENTFTCTVPELDGAHSGKLIGEMFQGLIQNSAPKPGGRQVPVRLQLARHGRPY